MAKGPGTIGLIAGALAGTGFILPLILYTGAAATSIGAALTVIAGLAIDLAVTAGLGRLFLQLEIPEYGEWGGPD